MAKFIELIQKDGVPRTINIEHVTDFGPASDGVCWIVIVGGKDFCLKEDYKTVKVWIESMTEDNSCQS